MVSRPDRAGRAATLISWVRMVAPRARACSGEASTPRARVSAWAVRRPVGVGGEDIACTE